MNSYSDWSSNTVASNSLSIPSVYTNRLAVKVLSYHYTGYMTAVNSKSYARNYIINELEKITTASKADLPESQPKLNYAKLDISTPSGSDDKAGSKIPMKPKPPVLANKPNMLPTRTSTSNKKPLIPQRPNNVIYTTKPKCPPNRPEHIDGTSQKSDVPKVQHLARKFSALGKVKAHKISNPTELTPEQVAIASSPAVGGQQKIILASVKEEEKTKQPIRKEHCSVTKSASTENSQVFPPQILISETIKHGSQDSGIADCSLEKNCKEQISSQLADRLTMDLLTTQEHRSIQKHGSYLKVEYEKPTNSTIEAFNIHLFEEEEGGKVTSSPAATMYGSQTDDEKVQYMYFNGSQESSCTVNSTDNDGYSLMKCPNKRISTDTYVEINNIMNDNDQQQLMQQQQQTMDRVRIEPGYLAAYRPESTCGYVDQHCNPVKRRDYCEDDRWDKAPTTDYSFNSIATLPHPKSPRKLSYIKDINGYVHEENLPLLESTALRRLIRHGNRSASGELYSYAKVPGIILPTLNKEEPLRAWGVEPQKKKSIFKKPPPIQPKSDSIRRSIMQHHYDSDTYTKHDNKQVPNSNSQPLGNATCSTDNSRGTSPNEFSSLDGPVFIDKFKTLETYGRDRSFSEFHALEQKPTERRQLTNTASLGFVDNYVSHEMARAHVSSSRDSKLKKRKKAYKLPPNVTSFYATIGAPAEYEVPHSEGDTTSPVTSPPCSPPKPIPAPRKHLIIDNLSSTVTRSTSRDRSKSLHDFTDTSDFDGHWKHPIRDRAKLVSRRKRKALKRTFSSENLLECTNRNEPQRAAGHWNRCDTIDTADLMSESFSSSTEVESALEHSDTSIDQSRHQQSRRVPLNDSIAKKKIIQRSHSQEDINISTTISPTITGYDIPQFRTKKPYVNLPPVVTANVEIGPLNFTIGTDNIYDTPRVPSALSTENSSSTMASEAECMYASGTFTHKGGVLTSAGSGVQIEIPEGAIARGKSQQLWFAVCQEIEGLDIHSIDSKIQSNSRMFEQGRNRIEVTPRVLVGPSDATFLKPIRIIIPHCVSPLHASWEFTALVRKEGSDEISWEEVSQQIINPVWSKKPQRRHIYQHTKFQLMLRAVMFTSLHPGWFVLAGEAIRSGLRAAKIMTVVIYCSKQEFENANRKLTLFVLLSNNTVDDRKVLHSILRSDEHLCLEEHLPVLCYGNGHDMELSLIHEQTNRPLQTKTIPFGKLWRQRRIGQAWTTLDIMAHMRPTLSSVSLQVTQIGSHDVHVESISLEK